MAGLVFIKFSQVGYIKSISPNGVPHVAGRSGVPHVAGRSGSGVPHGHAVNKFFAVSSWRLDMTNWIQRMRSIGGGGGSHIDLMPHEQERRGAPRRGSWIVLGAIPVLYPLLFWCFLDKAAPALT
jgi:hypothetical protein